MANPHTVSKEDAVAITLRVGCRLRSGCGALAWSAVFVLVDKAVEAVVFQYFEVLSLENNTDELTVRIGINFVARMVKGCKVMEAVLYLKTNLGFFTVSTVASMTNLLHRNAVEIGRAHV